jgi:hypothetical protein
MVKSHRLSRPLASQIILVVRLIHSALCAFQKAPPSGVRGRGPREIAGWLTQISLLSGLVERRLALSAVRRCGRPRLICTYEVGLLLRLCHFPKFGAMGWGVEATAGVPVWFQELVMPLTVPVSDRWIAVRSDVAGPLANGREQDSTYCQCE